MPREHSEPTESSNGLRNLAIAVSVIALIAAFVFYKRQGGAQAGWDAAVKDVNSLSNQVKQLETRLAVERNAVSLAQSNLQAMVDRRSGEQQFVSNKLVQASLLLSNAQHQAQAAQAELPARAAAVATLEARLDEVNRRLEVIPGLEKDVVQTREKLVRVLAERDEALRSWSGLGLEMAELERKLEDPAVLRAMVKKAEAAAALRQRPPVAGRMKTSDPRVQLQLQPDGTVKALPPPVAQIKK